MYRYKIMELLVPKTSLWIEKIMTCTESLSCYIFIFFIKNGVMFRGKLRVYLFPNFFTKDASQVSLPALHSCIYPVWGRTSTINYWFLYFQKGFANWINHCLLPAPQSLAWVEPDCAWLLNLSWGIIILLITTHSRSVFWHYAAFSGASCPFLCS